MRSPGRACGCDIPRHRRDIPLERVEINKERRRIELTDRQPNERRLHSPLLLHDLFNNQNYQDTTGLGSWLAHPRFIGGSLTLIRVAMLKAGAFQ
jgi:hypothetical protein